MYVYIYILVGGVYIHIFGGGDREGWCMYVYIFVGDLYIHIFVGGRGNLK